MTIESAASTASQPWASRATGIKLPGMNCVAARGFHRMNPVRIMTAVPQTTAQYSNFSPKLNLRILGGSSIKPRL